MLEARSLIVCAFVGLTTSACFLFRPTDPNATPTSNDPNAAAPADPSTVDPSPGSPGSGGSSLKSETPSQPEPPKPEKIDVVSVEVRNECSDKVEYCVDSGGSTLNTSLGGNTSTSSQMRPGTEIQLKKGSSCSTTLFTVPESRDRQKVVLCKK